MRLCVNSPQRPPRLRLPGSPLLALLLLCTQSFAQSPQDNLDTARTEMSAVIESLNQIIADRRGAARDADLIYALASVVRIEEKLLDSTLALGRATLGKPLGMLTEEQKETLLKLAGEQANASNRFTEWWEAFSTRYGQTPTTSLSRVHDQIHKNSVETRIPAIEGHLRGNHLPQAVAELKQCIVELRQALRFLEEALGRSNDALKRNIEQLNQLIQMQKDLLAETERFEDANTPEQRESFFTRQMNVRRPVEAIADSFESMGQDAAMPLREALPLMETSALSLRQGRFDDSMDSQRRIVTLLDRALELARRALDERGDPTASTPAVPVPALRRNALQKALMMMMGRGSSGHNPLAEIMNDLNTLSELRKQQENLRKTTLAPPANNTPVDPGIGPDGDSGTASNAGSADAGAMPEKQRSLGVTALSLSGRVSSYEAEAANAITLAAKQMEQAAGQLEELDRSTGNPVRDAAVRAQDEALSHLDSAQQLIQEFWDLLIQAMSELMQEGGQSMMSGGSQSGKELDEATRKEMMAMLLAMVRMNDLRMKEIALSEKVRSASNGADAADPAALAKEQEDYANEALAIAAIPLLDPHVGGAMSGIRSLMMGAKVQIEIGQWASAWDHQQRAIDGIRIVSGRANTMMAQAQSQSSMKVEGGQITGTAGETAGGGDAGGTAEGQTWIWKLPEREREVVQQTLSEPIPAEYDTLIRAYFQKLAERAGTEARP